MPSFEQAKVREVLSEREGLTRVRLDDGSRAYALTQLVGPVAEGDELVVNTTAVGLGLGTGGWHVVHWNLTRGPWSAAGPGHLMKLRYTSLQCDTGAAEEHDPDASTDLGGIPVVVAGLHSQLPVVAAVVAELRPGTRLVYVMTDGGALPLALSDTVVALADGGLVHGTITAGHAFGGDLEALNVPSALALARHRLDAEIVVVAMGPGVAGTASRLGTTAMEVAPALDAVAWLGGRPVACLRASSGDPRPRHRGVSHHSRTVLDAVRSEVDVAVPEDLDLDDELTARHRWHRVAVPAVAGVLDRRGLEVTTMGRGPEADPLFFEVSAAAGVIAAGMVDRSPPSGAPRDP